jgi:hypothetical protein
MIGAIQLESQPVNRGRPTKFTPERIQQICNLVERGKSRDEIAEIIGVTTGTLQVTCSKLGISLRRPTFYIGTGLLKRQRSLGQKSASSTQSCPRLADTMPESATEPQPVREPEATGKAQAGGPAGASSKKFDDRTPAVFAIRMEYKGQERSTDLPFDEEMIGQLAVEAEIRDMRIGELVGALILAIVEGDLFQLVRDDTYPRQQGPQAPPSGPESPPAHPSTFEG